MYQCDRKNLDRKTIELQNKVKYWAELSSGKGSEVPQVNYSLNTIVLLIFILWDSSCMLTPIFSFN